jgi:hypothetical protein
MCYTFSKCLVDGAIFGLPSNIYIVYPGYGILFHTRANLATSVLVGQRSPHRSTNGFFAGLPMPLKNVRTYEMVERRAVPRISSSTSDFSCFFARCLMNLRRTTQLRRFSIVDDDESTSDPPPAA